MSITIGVCARMGPWPSSCGSTAWSPGAQIVCAGTQPRAMIRSLTAARRSSAVKRRPSRRSQPSRPMRHGAQRGQARLQPRLRRAQRGLDRAHLVRPLHLALRPERVRPEVEADARARRGPWPGRAGSCAAPPRAGRRGAQRRARSPPPAWPCRPPPPPPCAQGRPGQHSSTRACARARSISRSLMTRMRRRPAWTNRNGSGAKKPVG